MINEHPTHTIKMIAFDEGIPGFRDHKKFYLKDFENKVYRPLKLMTSVDNPGLTFILYPHEEGVSDINHHFDDLFHEESNMSDDTRDVFTIVRVEEPNGHLSLSTNLKAPIVVDQKEAKGWQHILQNNNLSMTYPLEAFSKTLRQRRLQEDEIK